PDVKLRHFRVVGEHVTGADARLLTRYAGLAALAGAPTGDTAGERAADEANVVLLGVYRLFPGS
ncbi:MAG: hypothetical protein NUW21_08880, partial [Elusimicrobia bacterium]|nr:hypothetical protein [Elusimicrobiota bacterium]